VPPTASQTSAHSGAGASKRVVSNGKQVVLNSDSDSDSLPDLDFGGLTTSFKTVAPTTRPKRTTEYDDDGLRKPERRVKSKKSQFDHVVETAQRGRELERIISEHKANLEDNLEEAPAVDFVFDENVLGRAIHDEDDTDTAHRLFLAMQRTNATHIESIFHFFNDNSDLPALRSNFPANSLPEHHWTTSFRGKIKEQCLKSQMLTITRSIDARSSFLDRFRIPSLPIAKSSARTCFLDDRPKYVDTSACSSATNEFSMSQSKRRLEC
jgi:hypothetical protein